MQRNLSAEHLGDQGNRTLENPFKGRGLHSIDAMRTRRTAAIGSTEDEGEAEVIPTSHTKGVSNGRSKAIKERAATAERPADEGPTSDGSKQKGKWTRKILEIDGELSPDPLSAGPVKRKRAQQEAPEQVPGSTGREQVSTAPSGKQKANTSAEKSQLASKGGPAVTDAPEAHKAAAEGQAGDGSDDPAPARDDAAMSDDDAPEEVTARPLEAPITCIGMYAAPWVFKATLCSDQTCKDARSLRALASSAGAWQLPEP